MDFNLSHQTIGEETELWIPYPVSDGNQTITHIRVTGDYAESAVYTDNKFKVPALYARWNKEAKSKKLTFSFMAQRKEVIKKNFPQEETPWSPADYSLYLESTRFGPTTGKIKDLAEKITHGKTTVFEKAKAVYDWTCMNMYRNPDTKGCGLGDVYALLNNPGGKCADISSTFIAIARAAGVPSREVLGIRMGKKDLQDITTWQHCWAEFYLPGYGWVPVDPGDVLKMMLKHDLKPGNKKALAYQDYFWGGVEPYRVALSTGRDLILNPPQKGEPVNYLMYPFSQTGGKTTNWLDPENFKYTITYKK